MLNLIGSGKRGTRSRVHESRIGTIPFLDIDEKSSKPTTRGSPKRSFIGLKWINSMLKTKLIGENGLLIGQRHYSIITRTMFVRFIAEFYFIKCSR